MGYCAGGMLSAIYQALHPKGPVKNLVCFTTPIDFSRMTLFRSMSDERSFDLDRFVEQSERLAGVADRIRGCERLHVVHFLLQR